MGLNSPREVKVEPWRVQRSEAVGSDDAIVANMAALRFKMTRPSLPIRRGMLLDVGSLAKPIKALSDLLLRTLEACND